MLGVRWLLHSSKLVMVGSHMCMQVNALTRRYAAFAASCLTLMADHDSDDSECLLFLQAAYMACAAVLLPDRGAV